MKRLPPALLFLILAGTLGAAPFACDLGRGLRYERVATLPADLPAAPAGSASVLDLRFTKAEPSAAAALVPWLEAHASARHLVFLLVNAATAPAIREALAAMPAHAGLLTLGAKTADFTPDLIVPADAAAEQRAYAALPLAADPRALLSAPLQKPRYDEAAIAKAMNEGQPMPEEPAEPELNDADTSGQPPPLLDLTLQRAVQVQRAWLALSPP
jgi:hypothetical protein